MRAFKIYSLCNFQVYNTVLTIVTKLFITVSTYCPYNWKFVPFDQNLPISFSAQALATTMTLCFYELRIFFYIPHQSEIILFLSFICLTYFTGHHALRVHPCCHSGRLSIFLLAESHAIICMCECVWVCCHVLCIYSSIDWHIGCLPVLTVVDNAIVNVGVQISFQGRGFVESWSGIAKSCDSSSFNFLRNLHRWKFAFSPTVHKRSLAFTTSPACVLSFEESHSDRYEVIGNCFWFAFPWR